MMRGNDLSTVKSGFLENLVYYEYIQCVSWLKTKEHG